MGRYTSNAQQGQSTKNSDLEPPPTKSKPFGFMEDEDYDIGQSSPSDSEDELEKYM